MGFSQHNTYVGVSAQLASGVVDALKIGSGFEFDRIKYADTNNYTTTVTGTGAVTYDSASRSLNVATGANNTSKASALLNTRWNANYSAGYSVMFTFKYSGTDANSQFYIGLADAADGWGNGIFLKHSAGPDAFKLETWDGSAADSAGWNETAGTWTDVKLQYTGTSVICSTGSANGALTTRATNTTHIPGAVRASPVCWAYNGATATSRVVNIRDFRVVLG